MYKFKLKAQKVLFSMFLISTILGGMFTVPTPVEAATIKIMPLGDSSTEGMGDPSMGGYRTDLYNLYKNAGLDFDFVGSNKTGPYSLPDRDNEGHSGWTIPQIAGSIDNWLNTYNPDVILLWIGGNDVIQQNNINTTGLSNLIDQILARKPNTIIFVSDYYPHPDAIKPYNATIPGVVQQKANAGKRVYFVKLSDIQFSRYVDVCSDGLHLNPGGYSKIAKMWFDSTISILKEVSSTPTPTITPTDTPTATPTITPIPTPSATIIKGDVDGNGSVNSIDFGYLRKYLLGFESDFPSSSGKLAADINDDGFVNSIDFAALRLILLGKDQ